jgi:hypothetical protein
MLGVSVVGNLDDLKFESGIIVLDHKNIDSVLKRQNHLMVAFYAPFTGGWEYMKSDYERAHRDLEDEFNKNKGDHRGVSE